LETVPATQLLSDNYLTYGRYINNGRATTGLDGLKNVERRVLLSVNEVARTQFTGSGLIVGHTLGHYHPHGDAYPTLTKLVIQGLVEGYGSFGGFLPQDKPAPMRYTSVRAKQFITDLLFRLSPYVETVESEFGFLEPRYLPTPLPLALATTGSIGIGIGLLTNTPCFSPRSLYASLVNDDPSLLRAPKSVSIVASDVEKLWETGEGYIQYGLKCYQEKSDIDEGRLVSIIEGSPAVFIPDVEKFFSKELQEESVYIRNESRSKLRFVISRVKGLKRITDEDVHTIAQRASVKTVFCRMYVSNGTQAERLSLRDWLRKCWIRFDDALRRYKTDQETKLLHKIHIYNLIPQVYPLFIKNKGTKEIAGILNEPMAIIKEIEGKPLRLLRRRDFDEEIKKIEQEIREIKKLQAQALAEAFISELENVEYA
jgi:DNA gyrase/topoisomerase IV subunit A